MGTHDRRRPARPIGGFHGGGQAAATLGASPRDRFFSVALPLARPGFLTAAVLVLLWLAMPGLGPSGGMGVWAQMRAVLDREAGRLGEEGLEGKAAIVTGGSLGIGRAIALELLDPVIVLVDHVDIILAIDRDAPGIIKFTGITPQRAPLM